MKKMPKVLAMNDMSGVGRVALSCNIPIMSAMKCQVVPLPTVLLSTSTAFKDFTYFKLTDNMKTNMKHWESLNIQFDGMMTGFIGDIEQVKVISNCIDLFKNNKPLVLVDPVMADEGKLYSVYDYDFVSSMRNLVKKADIITPNVTEASLLLNHKIDLSNLSEKNIKNWAKELSNLGPNTVIITSVVDELDDKNICVIAYERKTDLFYKVSSRHIPVSYPGTGDIFASVIMGALVQKLLLQDALNLAVKFITDSIIETYNLGTDVREGILFENSLNSLMKF